MAEILNDGEYCFQIENNIVTAYYQYSRENVGDIRYVIKKVNEPEKYLGMQARYVEDLLPVPVVPVVPAVLKTRVVSLYSKLLLTREINDDDLYEVERDYANALNAYQAAKGGGKTALRVYFNVGESLTTYAGEPSAVVICYALLEDNSTIEVPAASWDVPIEVTVNSDNRLVATVKGDYSISVSYAGASTKLNLTVN